MSDPSERKTIARSLGECFGHIARGLRSSGEPVRRQVGRSSRVEEHDGVVLRRTIIEEVELKQAPAGDASSKTDRPEADSGSPSQS